MATLTVDVAGVDQGNMHPCQHQPRCPAADAIDREAAHTIACHPAQGWSLLCNGVVLFDDTGDLLPDGSLVAPHRGPCPHRIQTGQEG